MFLILTNTCEKGLTIMNSSVSNKTSFSLFSPKLFLIAVSFFSSLGTVAATASTDVNIESINAIDGAYEAGEDFRAEATFNNTGDDDSGVFKVNFYASTDGNVTSGDTLLGAIDINNIAAGASQSINESVDLPEGLIAGDYFVGAIIDLTDNDTSNNINVDETPIYVFTEFMMNAGLNDAWFNSVTNGQGFFITVFPDLGFVSLAWFTYDTEQPPPEATANLGDPGHRWLTAGGFYAGNQAVMDIDFTSGGIFDTPTDVQHTDPAGSDGTLTLTFDNCGLGKVEYDITSIDAQGMVPIKRVATDNVVVCNALLRDAQLGQ